MLTQSACFAGCVVGFVVSCFALELGGARGTNGCAEPRLIMGLDRVAGGAPAVLAALTAMLAGGGEADDGIALAFLSSCGAG